MATITFPRKYEHANWCFNKPISVLFHNQWKSHGQWLTLINTVYIKYQFPFPWYIKQNNAHWLEMPMNLSIHVWNYKHFSVQHYEHKLYECARICNILNIQTPYIHSTVQKSLYNLINVRKDTLAFIVT